MRTKGRCLAQDMLDPRAVGESRAPSDDGVSPQGPMMPRRQTRVGLLSGHHIDLSGIDEDHPASGARSLADMLPAVIGKAQSLGMQIVAEHLAMALKVAERLAADGIEHQG